MNHETLIISIKKAICTVTVNRPQSLNAINTTLFRELEEVLKALDRDKAVRVVVIQGAGERAFAAGADVKEMLDMRGDEAEVRTWRGMGVYDRMRRLSRPIVASIKGYALGGGMLLALACDIRIAAETALFGYPEIKLGLFPGTGGTVLLDRLIGPAAARGLCLTGEQIPAQRAYELGIVNRVVPEAELSRVTRETAQTLASYSPTAVAELKHILNTSLERDFESARAEEVKAYGRCVASEDGQEGIRAFIQKRPPRFRGR